VEQRAAEPILPPELFRNRVFSVTSAVGFAIGLSLFGTVTFMPLYLQNVMGHSATVSGLLMSPIMAGGLLSSIATLALTSRYGRSRPFPIAGTGITIVGFVLLSRLQADTAPVLTSLYMLVLGLGLGLVMQVLVLAAQNAVPYELLGVATSGSTLFRSIGGSIGVSIFGAIFANPLARGLAHRLPHRVPAPAAGHPPALPPPPPPPTRPTPRTL